MLQPHTHSEALIAASCARISLDCPHGGNLREPMDSASLGVDDEGKSAAHPETKAKDQTESAHPVPTHRRVVLKRLPPAIRTWGPALSLYSLLLGLLYQRTYWIGFDISAMSYMGLEDVIRASVVPLASVTFGTLGAAGIWIAIMSTAAAAKIAPQPPLPPLWLRIVIGLVLLLLGIGLLLVLLWNTTPLWVFVAAAVMAPLYVSLAQKEAFFHVDPASARPLVISGLIMAPFFAWAFATLRVEDVESGRAFSLATLPGWALSGIPGADASTRVCYLGHINDYDFFRTGKRTIVFRSQALTTFTYEFHDNREGFRIPFRDPYKAQATTGCK
jgi:hypothetical protein